MSAAPRRTRKSDLVNAILRKRLIAEWASLNEMSERPARRRSKRALKAALKARQRPSVD
jgi:hypothetical protein